MPPPNEEEAARRHSRWCTRALGPGRAIQHVQELLPISSSGQGFPVDDTGTQMHETAVGQAFGLRWIEKKGFGVTSKACPTSYCVPVSVSGKSCDGLIAASFISVIRSSNSSRLVGGV